MRATVPNPHELKELSTPTSSAGVGPLILFIVLDTFRADALDLVSPEQSATPALASLAQTSDVYTNVVANASWTLPGHASLFTGRFVARHRTDSTSQPGFTPSLDASIPTIHEIVQDNGYRTTCISANPILNPTKEGLTCGSQRYRNPGRLWQEVLLPWKLLNLVSASPLATERLRLELTGINKYATAEEIVDLSLEEIRAQPDSQFVFLNFMDTHAPTYPSGDRSLPPLSTRLRMRTDLALRMLGVGDEVSLAKDHRDSVRSYYRSRVSALDAELGRLFSTLDDRGWLDEALIVITADHGEAFGENPEVGYYFQHHSAYEPVVRIPLLVRKPGSQTGQIQDQPMQQVDVLPIVLDAIGLSLPEGLDGVLPGAPRQTPILTEWYPPTL